MKIKVNLTKLLAKMKISKPEIPTTDASYLPLSKDKASKEDAYSFELED